jgi:hypothetical protein
MTQENKPDYATNKSPREIETAIGETRAGLSEDIKALGDKANPANVKQEIKQAIKTGKEAVVGEVKDAAVDAKNVVVDKAIAVKDAVVDTAQETAETVADAAIAVGNQAQRAGKATWKFVGDNILPLALLGLGTGWLIANQRSTRNLPQPPWQAERGYSYPEYDDDGDELEADSVYSARRSYPPGGPSPAAVRAPRAARSRRPSTATMHGTGDMSEPRPTNGQPHSAIRDAAASISRGSRAAYDKVGDTYDEAERSLNDGLARSRDFVKEKFIMARAASVDFAGANPLALAFGTLLAGIGIGLLLPNTRREDEWLAPSRERARRALGDAREAAEDVRHVARQTAQDAYSTIEGSSLSR